MSARVFRYIDCNGRTGCLQDSIKFDKDGGLEESESNAILRGKVKKHGWHSTGDYDLCPTCYNNFFGEEE